jgi:hypothetical protein
MNKAMLIAGLIVLGTVLLWNSPAGFEWIVITAQVVIGIVLIVKSRAKAKPLPQP